MASASRASSPNRRSTARKPSRFTLGSVALTTVVTIVALSLLLPFFVVLFTAFKPSAEIYAYPPSLLPGHWTISNFTTIFDSLNFSKLVRNSFVFAGGVTIFALVFDSMAAYALARIDFRGRRAVLVAIVATLMIPFQATLVPVYQIVTNLGWVNSFAGLIAPRAADAFGIFLLRQFFVSLPQDIDNAARVDGASEWRIFLQIVIPNAMPALVTLATFTFVNNWNDLLWPLVFTNDPDMGTITSGLTLLTGPGGIIPPGVMMAGALVSLLPLFIAFIFVQRRFIESLSTTGLK